MSGHERVNLSLQKLKRFPDNLRQRKDMRTLDIHFNGISEVPRWIGELDQLVGLNLHGNEITELPAEIGNLTNLTTLDAYGNRLSELPAEIGNLVRLVHLDLHYNELTQLPAEITRLSALRTLNLATNKFTEFPTGLAGLPDLANLDLRWNAIRTIPPELSTALDNGLALRIETNPLAEPLPELLRRGMRALATYLRSLEDGVAQYEAKVLMLGEGNVGKTSLVAAMRAEEFVEGRDTTHGIEIHSITLPHPERDIDLKLHTWDFGGQEVYRITHQFFFSQRALYVVVWNAREGQEQNEVEGWVRRIRLRAGGNAPTVIVATHCDERNPELDYPELVDTFPGMLKGSLAVDNRSGTGIGSLLSTIALEAARLPQMGQVFSPRWTAVRNQILAIAGSEPQITYERFVDICATHAVTDEDEVTTLADLFHDVGQIIYYGDDDGLRDIVVLNPEWLTKAIGYVLEDRSTREAGGVLDHARLNDIWRGPGLDSGYQAKYHPFFLRLMEKFDVSYRLHDDPDHSLVAQLVPHERPALPWSFDTPTAPGIRSLALTCRLSEPAPGLVAWLTVRHHRASVDKHWRKGVYLRHPNSSYHSDALLVLTDERELRLEVRAPSPDLYFNVLRDSIEELVSRRWPGIDYQIFVPCPTTRCPGTFKLEGLLKLREQGKNVHTCLECVSEHQVSRLLTGFALPELQVQLDLLQEKIDTVTGGVERIEHYAADSAASIRRVLKAVGTEVTDCPRLFTLTLVQSRMRSLLKPHQHNFGLTLWCEQPGAWHPWAPASYTAEAPKEWFAQLRPYANLVLKTLRLFVPIGVSATEVGLPEEQFKAMSQELNLMKTVVEKFSYDPSWDDDALDIHENQLAPAEGSSLRQFRSLLFVLDRSQVFGGLRRVQAPSGEFLWVCPEHYREYDPGLPVIPGR